VSPYSSFVLQEHSTAKGGHTKHTLQQLNSTILLCAGHAVRVAGVRAWVRARASLSASGLLWCWGDPKRLARSQAAFCFRPAADSRSLCLSSPTSKQKQLLCLCQPTTRSWVVCVAPHCLPVRALRRLLCCLAGCRFARLVPPRGAGRIASQKRFAFFS